MLFVNEFASTREASWDTLFGLTGLEEGLDDEGRGVLLLVADDLLAADAVLLEELLGVFLLVALLTGVFKSCELLPMVKLNSLMGDTLDLLLAAADAFLDVDLAPLGLLLRDFEAEPADFFLMEAGVVLALDDLGLGVPLTGFEARFAGVGVCLAIVLLY